MKNCNKTQYTKIADQYTQELKNSEYPYQTSREIIVSGLRGLKTKIKIRNSKNQEFYREAHTTVQVRAKKKLVSKQNWYKRQECPQDQQQGSRTTQTGKKS